MNTETPITSHPQLPDKVPLVASFHDDRNRLSYYYPMLAEISGVRTPVTMFHPVDGGLQSYPDLEYREITKFMQDSSMAKAFVRGDFSSGKFDGETGSKIKSRDPYDIETVVLELFRQLARGKRHLGGRIAVREWIPHDAEVRYFFRDGEILYRGSLDDVDGEEYPDSQAKRIPESFNHFSWSVDFIRHENTGSWYCIDMGLDGLYHTGTEWVSISEHLKEGHSPENHTNGMPHPKRLKYQR